MTTITSINHATTVVKMYEAFGRGDIPYILSRIADNCEWIGAGAGSLPQGGTYVGQDVSDFFRRLNEAEEITRFNPISVHNIGDNEVVAFGNMTGKARATGKEAHSDWVMHWKFNEEGKAVYFHDYFDTAAAYIANQP